jgi:hypothetical protein
MRRVFKRGCGVDGGGGSLVVGLGGMTIPALDEDEVLLLIGDRFFVC